MDALELVRRRARSRRAAADADRPAAWELVRRLAGDEGYDLFPVAPDDALLAGAEAVLDRGIEAIFYNRDTEPAEAAALVAHELGHLDLHQGIAACLREEVDASSPDEPTPAGIHRIEAYGARERQELQANVYARELLLPRAETRRLFLDEGRRASGIATRLGLPIDLVRQQLCESLLTPEPPASEDDDDGAFPELDASQRAAAEHSGGALLLEAGPGTGKTLTLVARIIHLIEAGADPASILALTFSNKAAREITDRVADALPREAPSIWTGTFHGFGLEILRRHHQLVGLEPEIRVVDRSDAIELLEDMLPALGLKHHQNLYEPALMLKDILAAISRAKDELVDAEGYATLAKAMQAKAHGADERKAAEKAREVATVYDVYERALKLKKAVDFGDLIMLPARLLDSRAAVRAALRLRHRHVLVDEYQDVNRASARLLGEIAGDGRRLWVVGDSRQSIYRFRGASASNMALFTLDFPNATRRALRVNYRSTAEIVDSLAGFAPTMDVARHALPLELTAFRGAAGTGAAGTGAAGTGAAGTGAAGTGAAGAVPDARVVADRETEVAAVAARVLELRDAGVPLSAQAVLCRSNAKVSAFSAGLEARSVPVLHLGSLFERDEVRDMLSLLWWVVDRRGGALMRLAAFTDYAVPLPDVRAYLDAIRELEVDAGAGLRKPEATRGLSPEAASGLERLAADFEDVDKKASPWQILAEYLFDRSGYLTGLIDAPEASPQGGTIRPMRRVALYQFLNFVRQARPGGRGYPATRLLNKVRRLVLLAEERDLRQIPATALSLDGVRLMTIHGSKGLEFEAVHLPGMTTAGLPSSFRPPRCPPPKGMIATAEDDEGAVDPVRRSHDAEEECLFFVALSRAKSHLHLYRARTTGAVNRGPSPFLKRLRLAAAPTQSHVAAARGTDDGIVEITGPRPESTSGRELAAYERCPRQYFYSHLFRLAGTRRDSAFTKTHRSIYSVLDWLKQQPAGVFPGRDQVFEQLDEAWKEVGLAGNAFERPYRLLAETIVGHLVDAHQGLTRAEAEPLEVELPGGTVVVEPDVWIERADGARLLRDFRTGRRGSFRGDATIYGLLEAGARLRYGMDGYELDVLHLIDKKRTRINMSIRKIMSRCEKTAGFLADMNAGKYPAKPDPVRCPRCPYFFCCPTVPVGTISFSL